MERNRASLRLRLTSSSLRLSLRLGQYLGSSHRAYPIGRAISYLVPLPRVGRSGEVSFDRSEGTELLERSDEALVMS